MTLERWIRGSDETAAFDWARSARELDVPLELARALYVRAMRRALDVRRAETLFLRWLREAAAARRPASPPPAPGRQTRVTREARGRAWPSRELERLGPGKWTRSLLESDDARLPGADEVQRAIDLLGAGASQPAATADADGRVVALRDQLRAAAEAGHGAADALAKADPATAAAALRALRSQGAPFLRLVTRAAAGQVERVLGGSSASEGLPADLAARLSPHVTPEATGAARLHTDDAADLVASAHHARALTIGSDIYFARGEYVPGTARGDELIAHELTHVAQGQRGELLHAAAKGLDSGGNLDPSEAEADLRAKLAVIELHPATTPAPPLAAPSGQPTSDGDRRAKMAAQQQRLNLAGQAEAQLAVPPAPPAINPQTPVAHQPPPLPAPPQPASTGNAYVDTFNAPPSKQAMELWGTAGGKATTQAAADQAKFDASLPPMPVVLDGSEPKGAKGAPTGGKAPGQPPAAGAAPPAAQPTPTPPAPAVTTAATAAQAVQPTADKDKLKADGQKVIDNLPTTSPDVKTDPGPAPVTDLAGQADPVRSLGDHQHAMTESAKALDDAKTKVLHGPGAAAVQPVKIDQKLTVPKEQAAGNMPQLPTVEGMQKMKKWNLPTDALGSFDTIAKPKMEASLAQGKAKMTEAEHQRDADRTKAISDAQDKVKAAHADADKQQQAKVADTRTQIANHQADTLVKHEAKIKELDQQSGTKKTAAMGKINTRVQADQAKVESDYKDAQKKADDQKTQGEADARKKKEEAEKKKKDESWWDKAADAVCDGIKAIADEIDHALEAIGKAIGQLLDAVKDAACKVIDAARDFVCQALTEFGDWLKSAVTALIGSVFPELAAELNRLIDTAVNAAKAAVNAIADGLKKAVTALCDGLKGAIDGIIAAFRAAVQAAATFAQALVTGDWALVGKMILEGILKLLGIDPAAFYALIGKAMDSIDKIIENPGAFVGHLIDAVKLGFSQFGKNFWSHLKDGLVQWLFGTFASAGIHMPASFDIAGIFDLVCQVLGLTWPRLRGKVVKVIGEKNTERLEFVSKYIQALVTGGFSGLWQQVQQDMSGLWDMVVSGVKDWIIEKIVQQAIIKIATMWNPAGAIIQLIQTAWNVYCWVRENAQRIFGLVQAVVDSISNIVAGNIGGAANFIEASLAKLVPIAISLFADLIGLGGIADKIRGIIEKVQTKVDNAIDKLIDRVMGMFKGKGGDGDHKDGKDGDHKDGKDDHKPVGARVTFQAHGETHTQYIDVSGGAPVAMVASTPSAVKAKIEEWRPRLRELSDDDQKRAGKLIGKAIAIEKNVAGLAQQVKDGSASNSTLEDKQRELADTLAGLFELMAPEHDPSKALTDQDPRATLKSPEYAKFKARFIDLATSVGMPAGAAAAQDIWLKAVTTLQKTAGDYKAAPAASPDGRRKDLSSDAFQKIMAEFDPITHALSPYMEKWAHGKKSWAFWSGKPAVDVARKHAEVCLEKSALGSLFDGININGSWDTQLWASLSRAYASHAAQHVGEAKYAGFVGLGSSAEQSIFNKIEQPQFVSMLDAKAKANLHIDWYAVAGDPKTDMKVPDWRFHAGSFDGVYGTGDRAAMVALAESENKRRQELWNDKKVDEGPGGATADGKDHKKVGSVVEFETGGESHKVWIETKDGKATTMMASTPMTMRERLDYIAKALEHNNDPKNPTLAEQKRLLGAAVSQREHTDALAAQVMGGAGKESEVQAAEQALAATVKKLMDLIIGLYGDTHRNVDLDPDKDAKSANVFPDDAPIMETFRYSYNRLQSWKLILGDNPMFGQIAGGRFDALAKEVKERTKAFKDEFRSLTNTNAEQVKQSYKTDVDKMVAEIDKFNDQLAGRFKIETHDEAFAGLSNKEVTEKVHSNGTGVWRELWKDAMLKVNLVLDSGWPSWHSKLAGEFAPPIGNLGYIGSTAKGFKGPPKQGVRFNPSDFDVDANLDAPAIAKHVQETANVKPDKERLFMRHVGLNIVPTLGSFIESTHSKLKEIGAADDKDPFDVVVVAKELPEQALERKLKDRVWKLRDALQGAPDRYQAFLNDMAPYLNAKKEFKEGMAEDQLHAVEGILQRYGG